MAKRLLYIVPPIVFVGLVVMFYVGLGRDPSIVPSALIDQPVPEFVLPALKDEGSGLATTDLKGEVSLVNVFASWCVPCRVEHPLLMGLAEADEVRIHGINYKDAPDAATNWLRDLGDPYERIGADQDGRVSIDWGVYGVPETFIVDGEGRIRYKHVGPMTPEVLEKKLLPLIERLRS